VQCSITTAQSITTYSSALQLLGYRICTDEKGDTKKMKTWLCFNAVCQYLVATLTISESASALAVMENFRI